MQKYKITFIQYREYEVEAENDIKAIKKAETKFDLDMCSSNINTMYDEVKVEKIEKS